MIQSLIILFIVTSHAEMGDTGKPTGAWLEEVATPYYAFVDAGFEVVVVSPEGGKTPFDPRSLTEESQTESTKRFQSDPKAKEVFENTVPLKDIPENNYAAVFLPGGHGPMWDLAKNGKLGEIIVAAATAGKPIGAVCHGPAGLLPAKDRDGKWIFAGKKITAFTNSEEEAVGLEKVVPFLLESAIVEQGGEFSKGPDFQPHVVVDGNLVTGQNPPSSKKTAEGLIEILKSKSE